LDRAAALKALFDGALILIQGSYRDPFGRLWDDQQRQNITIGDTDVLVSPFSEAWMHRTDRAQDREDVAAFPVSKWLYVARADPIVRGLLTFVGVNGLSWISLYAILDYMKTAEWDHLTPTRWDEANIAAAAGVSQAQISLFRQTANNEKVLGPYARHGGTNYVPPKDPMKLARASDIMRKAAVQFLDQRSIEFAMAHPPQGS
jgi:hypothetical protein